MQVGIFKVKENADYGASLQSKVLEKALQKQEIESVFVEAKENQDIESLPEHIIAGNNQFSINEMEELKSQVLPINDAPFLLSKEEYDELKKDVVVPEPFILSYMVERNPKLVYFSNRMSRALGRPIVQRKNHEIFMNELSDVRIKEDGELLSLIQQAELIITNSYSVAAYAMIYKKPFVAMPKKPEGNPLADLLKEMGANNHMLLISREFDDLGAYSIGDENRLDTAINTKRKMAYDDLNRKLNMEVVMPIEKESLESEKQTSFANDTEESVERVNQKFTLVTQAMEEYVGLPKLYDVTKRNNDDDKDKKPGDVVITELTKYFIREIHGVVVAEKETSEGEFEPVLLEENENIDENIRGITYNEKTNELFSKIKEQLLLGKYVMFGGDHKSCYELKKYLEVNYSRLLILERYVPKNISFYHPQRYLEHLVENDESICSLVMEERSLSSISDKCMIKTYNELGEEKIVTIENDEMFRQDVLAYVHGASLEQIQDIPGNIGDIVFYRDSKGEADDLLLVNSPIGEKFFYIASVDLNVEVKTCKYELKIQK